MIILAGFFIVLATVPLFSGKLIRMADLEFQHGWMALLALWIQIPLTTFGAGWFGSTANNLIHLGTYGLALTFAWFNRSIPGVVILIVGAMANFLPIALNGGTMPARLGALEAAGFDITSEAFRNSGYVENARLWFLGDVFAIPASWPLSNVFSVGDVLLVIGGGVLVHWMCASKLYPTRHVDVTVAEFWARTEERNRALEAAGETVYI